jgi:hypothetical protein
MNGPLVAITHNRMTAAGRLERKSLRAFHFTIAERFVGGFGLAEELPVELNSYAPASHVAPLGLTGMPLKTAMIPPFPLVSITAPVVPLHKAESGENVEQELDAFRPCPTVAFVLRVGA